MSTIIHATLLSVAIGDALGVPVEFKSREYLKQKPVSTYMGYMCWNQPTGTWSDDSSLTFCTAESLCQGYNLEDMANKFVKWMQTGYWGAHNEVFDIGGTTRYSLQRVANGESPYHSGNFFEHDNGNGSLMRISPILFYLQGEEDLGKIYNVTREVSSITHRHFRSVFSCFIYIVFALELMQKNDKVVAYKNMQKQINDFILKNDFNEDELNLFRRILSNDIFEYSESEIHSSGYVLHSLESSIWCLMRGNSFEETMLSAVNLGGDTDTTGAITGGLAGLIYDISNIPSEWIQKLARKDDIVSLANKLSETYGL